MANNADYLLTDYSEKKTPTNDVTDIVLDLPKEIYTLPASDLADKEKTPAALKKAAIETLPPSRKTDPNLESRKRSIKNPLPGNYAICAIYGTAKNAEDLAQLFRSKGEMAYVLSNESGNSMVGIFLAEEAADAKAVLLRIKNDLKQNAWMYRYR